MPCLLLAGDCLVKTVKFENPTYIGDPVNVINIFNELQADEILLLDILASRDGQSPNFKIVELLIDECTAPLTFGGGITNVEQIRHIMGIGVEKVVINTRAGLDGELVSRAADEFGSQSIVISVDARMNGSGEYEVFIEAGTRSLYVDPASYAAEMERRGAGEVLITSVDQEGTMDGFDVDLIRRVAGAVSIPVIACGGAGNRDDLVRPVKEGGAAAVAAGSLFVFQGRNRAVVINLPTRAELDELFA